MDRKDQSDKKVYDKDYNALGTKLLVLGFIVISLALLIVEFSASPIAGIFVFGILLMIAGYRMRNHKNEKR